MAASDVPGKRKRSPAPDVSNADVVGELGEGLAAGDSGADKGVAHVRMNG